MNNSILNHQVHYQFVNVTKYLNKNLLNKNLIVFSTLLDLAFEIKAGIISIIFGQLSRICNQLKRRMSFVSLVRIEQLLKKKIKINIVLRRKFTDSVQLPNYNMDFVMKDMKYMFYVDHNYEDQLEKAIEIYLIIKIIK